MCFWGKKCTTAVIRNENGFQTFQRMEKEALQNQGILTEANSDLLAFSNARGEGGLIKKKTKQVGEFPHALWYLLKIQQPW